MPIVPGSALRITPAWIAALAAAAVGMTLGYPVACIIFEHELAHRVPAAFVGLTTGLLSMLVVLRAAGRATRTGTAVSAASWSFIAGGLNAGLAAQYQASGGRGEPSLAPFALASVIGLVFASPLSAGFALVNAGLALGAREARLARSHQSLDLMLGYAGATVAAFSALRLVAAPSGFALVPIALGALVFTIGFGRARARREWLSRVNLGEVPGLRIEILEGAADPALPCLLGRADAATAVLMREREEGRHYRDAKSERQVAVIDLWGP